MPPPPYPPTPLPPKDQTKMEKLIISNRSTQHGELNFLNFSVCKQEKLSEWDAPLKNFCFSFLADSEKQAVEQIFQNQS